jgi:hypothetical protein
MSLDSTVVFLLARPNAEAQPLSPGNQRLAETDRELLHLHIRPLGSKEVAQLMPEDDEAEAEDEEEDAEDVAKVHEISGL